MCYSAMVWADYRKYTKAYGADIDTDEPPPEVAAAGHDRCIVPIKASAIDAWLCPDRSDLAAQYAILDDRERPYYEHKLAA